MVNGLLTVEEAAEFMRVSKNTVYRALESGKLKSLRAGRQHRIRREDLEEYMNRAVKEE